MLNGLKRKRMDYKTMLHKRILLINKLYKLNIKTKVLISVIILLFLTILYFSTSQNTPSVSIEVNNQQYIVKQQTFDINVLARGKVKPEKVVPIKSIVSGNKSKLIWLVEDGEIVQKNQVIAKFDQTQYSEELIKIEQRVEDAKATYEAAEKSLIIQQEEEKKKIDNAAKQLEVAKLKVKDILNGSGILQKEKLELELLQAKRSYKIAKEELLDYDLLLKKGHVSKREKEKASDNAIRFLEIQQLKNKELANFNLYVWPKLKREAEILEETSQAEYRRSLRLFELEIQKRKNSLTKSARDLLRAQKQQVSIKKNLGNCIVLAPIKGQVYYKTLPRAEGARKIQIGDNIWAGQTFMEIPDTMSLILEAAIREFDVSKVTIGQEAKITLDAYANKQINGVVKRVNTLAEKNEIQGINRFSVVLKLTDNIEGVHIGMSGQAKIKTLRFENVMAVPVHYVNSNHKENWVWLVNEGHKIKQNVQIGESNHSWRVIHSGIHLMDAISL